MDPTSQRAPAPPTPGDSARAGANAVWVVHRDDAARRALADALGLPDAHLADPRRVAGRSGAADAAPPRAVVLAVSDDFEAELELGFRLSQEEPAPRWLVLADPDDLDEARRLFDTLPGEVLSGGTDVAALRRRLAALLGHRDAPPLSERQRRARLTERFTRWFADLDHPALFAATDPRRVRIPVLVTGEAGTGRGLLARYLHQLATGVPAGPLVSVDCRSCASPAALRAAGEVESGRLPSSQLVTLCLEDVDALSPACLREVARWVEYGAPGTLVPTPRVRFVATAAGPLPPPLRDVFAGLEIALPALRDHPDRLDALAGAAVRAWCHAHALPERRLSADASERLRAHVWPGNLRELDAVLARALARVPDDPLPASALVFDFEAPDADAGGAPTASPRREARETPPPEPTRAEPDLPTPLPGADALLRETAPVDALPGETTPVDALPSAEADLLDETFGADLDPGDPSALAPAADEAVLESVLLDETSGDDAPDALLDAPEMDGAFEPAVDRERGLRRLAGALAHEIGNPLVGIRSFAQMLPRRFEDPEFRRVAADRVSADTARIESALELLTRLAAQREAPAEREAIDLSAMVAGLLAERRGQIGERGLVVLEELDREGAWAWATREPVRAALVALFDAVFDLIPERGDLYVATQGPEERGFGLVRALVRFSSAESGGADGLAPAEHSLGIASAELLLGEQGGRLVLDLSEAPTALVLFELPAAGA